MSTIFDTEVGSPDSFTSDPISLYQKYLSTHCPSLQVAALMQLQSDLQQTNWEEPQTALDLNNLAVMALIEAEQSDSQELRPMGLDMALDALSQAIEMQPSHPLCLAQLALVQNLIGETQTAIKTAFPALLELLQYAYNPSETLALGLVYLPFYTIRDRAGRQEAMQHILSAESGTVQAMRLLVEVLNQAQLVFYNQPGKRFLQLATQIMPVSTVLNLKLGIAHLMQEQLEGLQNLQHSRTLAPQFAPAVQALYLAYRDLQPETAAYWLEYGRECACESAPPDQSALATSPSVSESTAWQWTTLEPDSAFTYLPFDGLLMAVDPSLKSIVTSVLLAEGDWFEAEIEFWRTQLQPGMTVIDVGANVGLYTFSAAQRVGKTGRVFAVEPFSRCVACLHETQRLNLLDWVQICAGAASADLGTARLSLQASSELNEVVIDGDAAANADGYETIACFPLDSLIASAGITQVDWLKIDAEGHEMQVLAGSEAILDQFAPGILYENVAGGGNSNTPVAEYLQSKGYRLFRYQPYLQNLIPIASLAELQGNLNVIALPESKLR